MKKILIGTTLACLAFSSCKEIITDAPVNSIARISSFERDFETTCFSYDNNTVRSIIVLDEYGSKKQQSSINYSSVGISCNLHGVSYSITPDNTRGGWRVKNLLAVKNNALFYRVEYFYDELGRLSSAHIEKSGEASGSNPYVTISLNYSDDRVIVSDDGIGGGTYTIMLSEEANVDNVCNVLDFAESKRLSEYVMNPDFYYLNIFGTPVSKLPAEEEIKWEGEGDSRRLVEIGKYKYNY
jgi:hypothetical protein